MTITIDQAKTLTRGTILMDSNGNCWTVNATPTISKRDPDVIQMSLRRGIRQYANLLRHHFDTNGVCHEYSVWVGPIDPLPEHVALATRDASLGVGHVWTITECPAYRTLNPAHCDCDAKVHATKLVRVRYLLGELAAGCISYGELIEVDDLAYSLGVVSTEEMMADDTLRVLESILTTRGGQ